MREGGTHEKRQRGVVTQLVSSVIIEENYSSKVAAGGRRDVCQKTLRHADVRVDTLIFQGLRPD